jgi:hypothetical protein
MDCLEAYADDYIPLTINASSAQSAQSDTSIDVAFIPATSRNVMPSPIQSAQPDKLADISFIFPMQNLFFDSMMELISPV